MLKRLKEQGGEVQENHLRGNQWRGCGEEESGGQEHVGRQMPFVRGEAGSAGSG